MPPIRPHTVAIDATNRVHTLWHTCYHRDTTLSMWIDELRWLRDKIPHTRFVTCWDEGRSYRKGLDPTYKANRSERPIQPDLGRTLGEARLPSVLPLGVESLSLATYEADDVLASLAWEAHLNHQPITLISPDKDLLGCLRYPEVKLIGGYSRSMVVHHSNQLKYRDRDYVKDTYHIPVEQWLEYQCLVGDAGDNVQGWVGVGPATAAHLLNVIRQSKHQPDPANRLTFEDLFSSSLPSQKKRAANGITYSSRVEADRPRFEARFPIVQSLLMLVECLFV